MGLVPLAKSNPTWCMQNLIRKQNSQGKLTDKDDKSSEVRSQNNGMTEGAEAAQTKKKPRGSMTLIRDILKFGTQPDQARAVLRKGFLAESSRAAQPTRREQVMTMAKEVCGGAGKVFPLKNDAIEAVAAAMKCAGWASTDQYLNELKLMHVEAGCNLPTDEQVALGLQKIVEEKQRTSETSPRSKAPRDLRTCPSTWKR